MQYDEESELTRYVWDHYLPLVTDFERRVGTAIIWRQKAVASGSPQMARTFGKTDDPEIGFALSEGAEAFRRRVRGRLLVEHAGEVFVNRCPNCERVVRTPRAQQCLWCGHDWHEPK